MVRRCALMVAATALLVVGFGCNVNTVTGRPMSTAAFLERTREVRAARPDYDRLDCADQLLPGLPEISLLRGNALEKAGRAKEAVEAYRKVLTLVTADTEVGQEATKRLQALGVV